MNIALAALLLAALSAGCATPEETAACARPYVTMHFDGANATEALRARVVADGYGWDPTGEDVVALETPGDSTITAILAPQAGEPSASLVVSVEGSDIDDRAGVRATATDLARLVNETAPDATLVRWVDDEHTGC